jgi:ribulose-bisphosphate carboxylase large chain
VFPNVGGRFGFTAEECLSIADACRNDTAPGLGIFPSPGGGTSVDRATDMIDMYGEDAVFLLGGNLLRYGDNIGEGLAKLHKAINASL